MCLPAVAAIASVGSGILGAVGSHQSAQAQADATNAAARRNYKYALAKRKGEWGQQLSIYRNKVVDYENQYSENSSAAARSYAAEQYRLNEQFQQAAFQKQDMLAQLISQQGGIAASGRIGKTAARMDTALLGAFGRNNAILAENLASARNAAMQRNEDTRLQMVSANNRAWSQVAMAPTPDVAPPPPTMVAGPSGIGLASGILGSVASGIGAYNSLKAPNALGGNPPPFSQVNLNANPFKMDPAAFNYNWKPMFGNGFNYNSTNYFRP